MPAPKSPELRHYRKTQAKLVLIAIALCVVLAGSAAAVFLVGRQSQEKSVKETLNQAVTVRDPVQDVREVRSHLGMKASYDSALVSATGQVTTSATDGQVTGMQYSDDDLAEVRSYNILKFRLITDEPGASYFTRPELSVLTNARQDYFGTRTSKYPGLNQTEITVREFDPSDGSPDTSLVSRTTETINGIAYEKLLYKTEYTSGVIGSYVLQYVTVQYSRPFVVNLYYYPSTKEGDIQPLIKVLESLTFAAPDEDAEYLTVDTDDSGQVTVPVVAGTSTIFGATSDTVNVPDTLKGDTDLTIVAKNQLAVVRVGAIGCYDFSLLGPGGSVAASFQDACAAGIGSGSIVRKDGIVGTNGHVTETHVGDAVTTSIQIAAMKKDFTNSQKYLDYFVAYGVLDQTGANAILRGLKELEPQAYEAMVSLTALIPESNFKVSKQSREYAIQLGNDPIRLDLTRDALTFYYDDSVVKAKYIDSVVDSTIKAFSVSSPFSDVALLQIEEKRDYPVVQIGKLASLRSGSDITVVGFPAFVDGGIISPKLKTIPSATQGDVTEILQDAGGHLLALTDAQAAQGNSGGPAFGSDGKQVGLLTYAGSSIDPEGGKTKFGATSIIRDVADLTDLAADNDIVFDGSSSINDLWYPAIEALAEEDYRKAQGLLEKVSDKYGEHYLIASLLDAVNEQVGTKTERLIRALGFGMIPIAIAALVYVVMRLVRHRAQRPPMMPYSPMPPQAPHLQY